MAKQRQNTSVIINSVASTRRQRQDAQFSARNFSCQNKECDDFKKTGLGNISLVSLSGRKRLRLFVCANCGQYFSELKGSPLFDSRLDWVMLAKVYESLVNGVGIRATGRAVGVSKNTVKRYMRLARGEENINKITEILRRHSGITVTEEALNKLG